MSKTREELINKALGTLQVLAVGQSVNGTDVDKMDAIVDPAIAELSSLEIYYAPDVGELGPSGGDIDDAAFLSLANYLAAAAGPDFGFYNDDRLQALAMLAEAKLLTISAPARTLKTLRVDPALTPIRVGYYRGWPN